MILLNSNGINELTFDPDSYKDIGEMWDDIKSTLKILCKNSHIYTINQEDFGIILIKYAHDESDEPYGVPNPEWISPNEHALIKNNRMAKSNND